VKTYGILYKFFQQHTAATLRMPIARPDSVRMIGSVVPLMLIGMLATCIIFFVLGLLVAALMVQTPLAAWLREKVANTLANWLFYTFILWSVVVPLLQRYRSGPALYVLEMYFLQTGFIKAYFRVAIIAVISVTSFFYPAQNMFPDGYECWEPGHCVFCAYVCERIEQDEIKRQVFASLTDDARARVCDLVEGVEPKWPNESKGAQLPSTSTTEASVPPPSGDFE